LLLQSWYGLSDPGLEKQLARDLMFRRFINLGLSEGVPDHSTVWRFRNTLTKQGLLDTLLLEVNQQLSAKGLYIKTGEVSIVDATVIEAKQSRPRKGKDGGNTQTARRATTSRSPPTARRPALTAIRRTSTSMKTVSSKPLTINPSAGVSAVRVKVSFYVKTLLAKQ
jgi:transposase, IS5 family